ncbi:MAG: RNA polymerase sigma factor [Candidatus Gracilibacteria bacterium]
MSDSQTFTKRYEEFAQKIYAFIYYRTQDRATAEDLTSQTFLKALEKWESFDLDKGSFKSWIYKIARNTICDHYRELKPQDNIENVFDLADEKNFIDELKKEEVAERVKKALSALTQAQREVVLMRVWDELPYKEISIVLGKTEASLKMAFKRALIDLQKQLIVMTALLAFFIFTHF